MPPFATPASVQNFEKALQRGWRANGGTHVVFKERPGATRRRHEQIHRKMTICRWERVDISHLGSETKALHRARRDGGRTHLHRKERLRWEKLHNLKAKGKTCTPPSVTPASVQNFKSSFGTRQASPKRHTRPSQGRARLRIAVESASEQLPVWKGRFERKAEWWPDGLLGKSSLFVAVILDGFWKVGNVSKPKCQSKASGTHVRDGNGSGRGRDLD